MDYQELYDLRKKLVDWKKFPKETLCILKSLEQSPLEWENVNKSKIQKTLQALTLIDDNNDPLVTTIKAKASALQDRFKRLSQAKAIQRTSQEQQQQAIEEIKIQKQSSVQSTQSSRSLPCKDLFENHRVPYPAYADRLKYLKGINQMFIANIFTFKKDNVLNDSEYQTIKECVEMMENTIYHKRAKDHTPRKAYEQDLRILAGFLKKDKNGSLTYRIFTKAFDPVSAAQLRAADWVDDETKQEQARIIKEKMEAEQIGFYKDLSKREMEGIEGKTCKGCGQKKVYLVDEKQTRASDEPTTKFFECYNCGDKFRIC
ncbi:unnamed protein product (macronuclear) [Paramecium tetraurelia]|uniref:TFIIS-type domain-containing protein n=1 Tax=Paramecium tetraurelia TaxID=5888 RepID=A0CNA6_PARTE|nr:uncharacterized protein GSPATT00008714001 [Paramecium tetraurelia]CAK72273.1 unnamed protein product [Paramecium tetraurelia]|eukprot:XP_001439670.1 hypothetical protein (macronuclear) [Paramecium tetraurelia strain d4-2]